MKTLRRVLKITGITLFILIGILFAAPFFFKARIVKIVKTEINKNINAKTDFADLSLSFFRHFPRVSVSLENLSVVGVDVFARDTLISAEEIDVALNIFSVLNTDDMKISSININKPRIHAIVTREGRANWDIAKPDEAGTADTAGRSAFKLSLQHYSIKKAYIKYEDASAGMSSEILNLDHEGSGDFNSDQFILQTKSSADAISFVYDGIPYLSKVKTAIDADIQIDNSSNKYNFKTDKISLNDLVVATEGFFQLQNDSTYNMDIQFKAPSTEFRNILSLVPAVYQKDFANIKTSGKALFDGFVKGTYSNTQIPAYSINLNVQDGFFQYPDLPQPVKNINLLLKVNNPDGVTDNTVIDITKGHIEFGNDPFDFHLLFKKPVTDQYIDAAAKGKLDLAGISRFVKLEPGTQLGGILNADVQAAGNLAVVMHQKPGNFSAKGFIDIQNLQYASRDFPEPIRNTNAKIEIQNPDGLADHTIIRIPAAHVEVGKDAADLTLLLKTPASDPDFDGTVKGSFDLAHVKQFYDIGPGSLLEGIVKGDLSFKGKKSSIDKGHYEAIKTAGNIQASALKYTSRDYPDGIIIRNAALQFNPKNATIQNLSGSFLQTNFDANGYFDNLLGYALKDERLSGSINVHADKVDLNKWMGTSSNAADTNSVPGEPFAVPANINMTLNAKVDELKYDKVEYKDIHGALQVKDQAVDLKNIQMQALDGSIALSGSYSTKQSKKKPDISMTYDVQDLDVQKTFYAFNTIQKLMPIGKFIAGKLSSKMSMRGKLGEDMMPDMGTLTGEGTLFLIQGFLSKFQPMEKLASTLNVADLQQISVKDIKNYFEFANGKVLVKPFHVKVKDIDMEIGGMHGLDQSIDYAINLKVPREKLGEKANQLVNNLAAQAAARKVPVKLGETVSFRVNMGGSISNPSIKTDLQGATGSLAEEMKGQVNELVQAKKKAADSVVQVAKNETRDSLQSVKKQFVLDAQDALKKQLTGKKEDDSSKVGTTDSKKRVEESAKGLLNSLLKKKKKDTDTTKKE